MGNFNIDIQHPIPEYERITSTETVDTCDNNVVTKNVGLIASSDYNLISSYTSTDPWDKLVITSVQLDDTNKSVLKYNGNQLTNADFPLEIDISAVNSGEVIPNLTVDISKVKFNIITNEQISSHAIVHFYIKTSEAISGDTKNSMLRAFRTKCLSPVNPTISNLTVVTNANGIHKQTFRITGEANTTYKLKILYNYNERTGAYVSTLQNTDSLSFFSGVPPTYPTDNVVVSYTTNGTGIINLDFTVQALSTFLTDKLEPGGTAVQNCIKARLTLYNADDTTLNLTESVLGNACTTLLDLGGGDDTFFDDGNGDDLNDLDQFFK